MASATLKVVPARGGRLVTSKRDARIVYQEFERLKRRQGNSLTPETVLESARSARSPLHHYFDWNNTSAAEKWRLRQSRQLIQEVNVIISYEDRPDIRTRAIVSVVKPSGKTLEAIEDVMGDEEYQQQLLSQALAELNIFRRKYAHLNILSGVLREADRVLKRFEDPSPRRAANRRR